MREYFMMIVGAAVLSALSSVLSPEKWRGYIRLVTGIVILCCVIAPAAKLINGDGFSIPDAPPLADYDENLHRDIVIDELTRRVEEDIEARIKRQYGAEITARVEIDANDEGEIEGVTRISVSGGPLTYAAKRELCNIYGVDMIYEEH